MLKQSYYAAEAALGSLILFVSTSTALGLQACVMLAGKQAVFRRDTLSPAASPLELPLSGTVKLGRGQPWSLERREVVLFTNTGPAGPEEATMECRDPRELPGKNLPFPSPPYSKTL